MIKIIIILLFPLIIHAQTVMDSTKFESGDTCLLCCNNACILTDTTTQIQLSGGNGAFVYFDAEACRSDLMKDKYCIGFRMAITNTLTLHTFTLLETATGDFKIKYGEGQFTVYDSRLNEAIRFPALIPSNKWVYFELYWYCNDAGLINIFINGSSIGEIAGDFYTGVPFVLYRINGTNDVDNYLLIDDIYMQSGLTRPEDKLGDLNATISP